MVKSRGGWYGDWCVCKLVLATCKRCIGGEGMWEKGGGEVEMKVLICCRSLGVVEAQFKENLVWSL